MMIASSTPKLHWGLLAAFVLILITTVGIPQRQSPIFHLSTYTNQISHKPKEASRTDPTWLIATICAANQEQRRNVIRSTWQTTYNSSLYDTRFVLSNYDKVWDALIQKENETYGDIIQLKDLDPSPGTSNRIKMVELMKYLVNGARNDSSLKYDWVSKIDSDAFLEANKFYKDFLNSTQTSNRTLISRVSRNAANDEFDWPGGAFYTLSWELVEQIAYQSNVSPILETPEDVLVGEYLYKGNVHFDFVNLGEKVMFDVPVDGAYVPRKITDEAILIHFIKDDEKYLEVASLFDQNGFTGKQIEGWTEKSKGQRSEDDTEGERKLEITHEPEGSKAENKGGFKKS